MVIRWRDTWTPIAALGSIFFCSLIVFADEPQQRSHALIYYEEPELTGSVIASLNRRDDGEIHFGFFPDAISVRQETVDKIQEIDGIAHLGFYLSNCFSIEWQSVSRIRSLKHLDISGEVRFSSDDLNSICQLPSLEELTLAGDFDHESTAWPSHSSLKSLTLHGSGGVSFCTSVASAKLKSLSRLELREDEIDMKKVQALSRVYATQLTNLDIGRLKTDALGDLAAFEALESLSVKLVGTSEVDLDFVSRLNRLQRLAILDGEMSDEQIKSLGNHPSLRHIYMNRVILDDSFETILNTIPFLETIQFADHDRPREFKPIASPDELQGQDRP